MATESEGDALRLRGRVAVVTGGGRGIGRAIVRALTRAGADVALCARTAGEIEAVAAEARALGRQALAVPTDVAVRDQVRAFAAADGRELGRVDLLVNNAGGGVDRDTPIAESEPARSWRAVEVNLCGTYLVTRELLGLMGPGGASALPRAPSQRLRRAVSGHDPPTGSRLRASSWSDWRLIGREAPRRRPRRGPRKTPTERVHRER